MSWRKRRFFAYNKKTNTTYERTTDGEESGSSLLTYLNNLNRISVQSMPTNHAGDWIYWTDDLP